MLDSSKLLSFPKPMQKAVSIKGLNFYYNKKAQALYDINLDIQEHAVTALIGASGSGKSTLLRVINRIYEMHGGQFASGYVGVGEENILQTSNLALLRKKIGLVFQKPTIFPMSIFQNVAFALKHHEKLSPMALHERVKQALVQSALWNEVKDRLKHPATNLSGGQQQRLCLARVLAMRPKILLLDEPTSALDPASTDKIEEVVLQLKEQYTLVLVTHNLRQAKRVADYVGFLQNGRLIEYANKEDLFSEPKSATTAEYIAYA